MIYFSELNPVKFVKVVDNDTVKIDYINFFPSPDSFLSTQAMKGIFALKYRQKFIKDVEIVFQVQYNDLDSISVNAYIGNFCTPLAPTDITPAGWSGLTNKVYSFAFTPDKVGEMHFELIDNTNTIVYISERYDVEESLEGYYKVQYFNNSNDLGAVFFDSTGNTQTFEGVIYLEMFMKPVLSGELDTYQDDKGSFSTLRPTPIKCFDLKINRVSDYMVQKLGLIFSCDNIRINGVQYSPVEKPESEPAGDFGNNNNVSLTIAQVDWNYLQDEDAQGYEVLGDEDGNFIVDEFGNKIAI